MDAKNETIENLSETEKILNSNDKITTETVKELISSSEKKDILIKELREYAENNKPECLETIGSFNEIHLIIIDTDEKFSKCFENFRINSRESIISRNQKMVFLLRQEELLSIISNLQKKLEEYDKYVKSHTDKEAMTHFTNNQLNEFATIRSQSIPMYMIELESLANAIDANNKNYENSILKSYTYAKSIIKYLLGKTNGDKE